MAGSKTDPTTTLRASLEEVHEAALARAEEAYGFEHGNIREGRSDQKFYYGDQWDDDAKTARGEGRPMLTINRLGTFVRQVTGDIRQNTPAIKVMPAGGPASEDKAKVLSGIIRSIEAQSDAAACYEKGASNAAKTGQGWFRVLTRYCDETSFDQEICIEQGADPFGVLIDPFARRPDKSDMKYAFVIDHYSRESFKAKWPDALTDDFPVQGTGGAHFGWAKDESVVVAEYWCRETTATTLYELIDGTVTDIRPPKEIVRRERTVEAVSIVSYMISGREVLSGPHQWAGKVGIPVCFIPGEEETIEGATRRKGMVRDAKDPQRLLNYARTTDAESTALQPKAPYVVTVNQIRGNERIWESAGSKNHPFLPYTPDPLAPGPPQRSQPPAMSSGLQSLSVSAGNDLHDVIGIYPASLGARSNETSGVAIRARQHEGDTGSNYIPDNTRRAIAYCGRILCELIPKIYDAPRIVRMLKESGEHEMAAININDLEKGGEPKGLTVVDQLDDGGKYDVVVSTGKSYATRQEETADMLVALAGQMPQIGAIAPDLLIKALNFPGSDELAARLKKTVPAHLIDENAQPQPNPKDLADARESMASANLKDAQAAKTLLEADTIAAQLAGMGAQLQQLTQFVMGLGQGGGGPPQGPAGAAGGPPGLPGGPPIQMAGPPPAGPPGLPGGPPGAMLNGGPMEEGEIVDLEPMGPMGAPV